MLGLHCAGESTAFQFALGGIGVFREGSASRFPRRHCDGDRHGRIRYIDSLEFCITELTAIKGRGSYTNELGRFIEAV